MPEYMIHATTKVTSVDRYYVTADSEEQARQKYHDGEAYYSKQIIEEIDELVELEIEER